MLTRLPTWAIRRGRMTCMIQLHAIRYPANEPLVRIAVRQNTRTTRPGPEEPVPVARDLPDPRPAPRTVDPVLPLEPCRFSPIHERSINGIPRSTRGHPQT